MFFSFTVIFIFSLTTINEKSLMLQFFFEFLFSVRAVAPRFILRTSASADITAALLLLFTVGMYYRHRTLYFCRSVLDQLN